MIVKAYSVAIVIGNQGLSHNQIRWINKTLTWITKNIETGQITVMVSGLNDNGMDNFGIPRDIWNRPMPKGVTLTTLPGAQKGMKVWESLSLLYYQLRECDEVWCCPGDGQTHRLARTKPNRAYQFGKEQIDRHRYKWIPPWIDPDDSPKVKPKGKGAKK